MRPGSEHVLHSPNRPKLPITALHICRNISKELDMKVTLKQVAAAAGVSTATASKAMNRRGDISAETRDAVMQAAEALGYFPSRRAGVSTDRPSVAVVTDSLDPFYGVEVLRGLVEEGGRRGVDVVPHIECDQIPISPSDWEDKHLSSTTIGIVLVVYRGRGPVFEVAKRRGLPVVAIDPYVLSKDAAVTVSCTNWEGGKTATEHLLELGHRRIALISGDVDFLPGSERLHGYRAALEESGIKPDNQYMFTGTYTFGSGHDAAEQILQLPELPTAVFAINDRSALGAIRAFEQHGLRVPADISVIGFDNSPGVELMNPPLTTIRQPMAEMGRLAVQVLAELAEGHQPTSNRIKLATGLVVRASTAPPNL